MIMDDAYMVGSIWLKPGFKPEFQERSVCRHCDKTESMEHILTECGTPGQEEVWKLAEKLWMGKNIPWHKLEFGTILASGNIPFKDSAGQRDLGATRLYRILIAGSAYLIWKMRCERVIQNENQPLTAREVHNKWVKDMDLWLEIDCQMTNPKFEKKALRKGLVRKTWKGTVLFRPSLRSM